MQHILSDDEYQLDSEWFRENWAVAPTGTDAFRVWQRQQLRGECRFLEVGVDPCRGQRGEEEIAHSSEYGLYMSLYRSGNVRFNSKGAELLAKTGDLLLWDPGSPNNFECYGQTVGRTILFPREMVRQRMGLNTLLAVRKMDWNDPRTPLLHSHFMHLYGLAHQLPERILRRFFEATLELAYLCVIDDRRISKVGSAHTELYERIRNEVNERIGCEDLKPATIASSLGLNVRRLQDVLAARGTTFSAMVRDERMDRAGQILRSPASYSVPISEIALSLGFYDTAHFSNAFRAFYKISPRQYRKTFAA